MQNIRRVIAALLLGLFLTAYAQTGVFAAANPKLNQLILPIDCVFETVNDGLGTIHYLTPEECGQVIPPEDTGGSPSPTTPTQTPTTSHSTSKSSFFGGIVPTTTTSGSDNNGHEDETFSKNGVSILLNTIADSFTNKGYVVTVYRSNVLFYRPSDDSQGAIRSIIFEDITSKTVKFEIEPFDKELATSLGQTMLFDHLRNGQPAVSISMLSSAQANGAVLRIKLLHAEPTSVHTSSVGVQLGLLGLTLVFLVSLRLRPHWFGGRGSQSKP